MADREKVMRALKIHAEGTGYICQYCIEECCPYVNSPLIFGKRNCDISQMCIDALALLKEQEAVEPTLVREGRNKYYNDYVCPRCDNEVDYEQNYCSECGVEFLWEGR